MSKQKRDDEPVKVDREVLRVARSVAALRGLTLAEYVSERLRPLVLEDHEEETRKLDHSPHKTPRKKEGGRREREESD